MGDADERLTALWPRPRTVVRSDGARAVSPRAGVLVVAEDSSLLEVARSLARELTLRGWDAEGALASSPPRGAPHGLRLALHVYGGPVYAGREPLRPQGYRLRITGDGVELVGADTRGLFYGTRTLLQLLGDRGSGTPTGELALCTIEDAPAFEQRGFMLDVSRDKVPTLATLFRLVDLLANYKVNQLQLYMEHTFAYRGHESVWAHASPLTAEDVRGLDAYCRDRFIELVPNQNSFGHMQRWLSLPEYRHLAECPAGFTHPWNPSGDPYGLCPDDPGSLALLTDLYDQLLPHFESRLFNVGLDETIDLGVGRSRQRCEREGTERVYLRFLRDVHGLLSQRGHTMQFWADIVLRRPELVGELPRDAIALAWGYEHDHPFAREAEVFARAGIQFYVCPGTSSWNALAGRTENALGNLIAAARAGVDHGAHGYLVTDWGDNGHLQPLPVSYLGLAAGAGLAWNADACEDLETATVRSLNDHVFEDRAGVVGGVARDLGNAYLHAGTLPGNASALFGILLHPERELSEGITRATLRRVCAFVEEAARPLAGANMRCPDAALVQRELTWVRDALLCAARLGLARVGDARAELCDELRGLAAGHRENWLARNRPGGLSDSESRLAPAISWACAQGSSGDPAGQVR